MELTADVIFDYIVKAITCCSPIIIAWFGFVSARNEKQTKKYIESQESLKKANDKLKEKEKEELQAHFAKLEKSIGSLTTQVSNLEKSVGKISEIDKTINNLVEMSNINFEFCQSLSAVISSIGNALDSSDAIESGTLRNDLSEHQKRERNLVSKVCKIVY